MTSQQPSATTIWHSVVVDAPIDKAFKVFTEDFGRFKPAEHNMLGVDIAETVFEPRAGGSLYDR
ncbi:MAG: ATPase, partial [Acidimicrobiales bacterium]